MFKCLFLLILESKTAITGTFFFFVNCQDRNWITFQMEEHIWDGFERSSSFRIVLFRLEAHCVHFR